jgi:hypothetical protein
MDPTIQDPCGSDANWCFLTEDLTKEEYERMFPNASPVSSMMSQGVGDQSLAQWLSEDTVRIAEYFYIEHKSAKLNLYPDNVTAIDGTPQDKQLKLMFQKPIRSRNVDKKQVKWLKTNGFEVLQEQDWAGKWIPVIRVVGNEWEVDGQLYVSGLVRNAKDVLILNVSGAATSGAYNCWVSSMSAGSATVTLRNITGGALSEAVVLNFVIIHCT